MAKCSDGALTNRLIASADAMFHSDNSAMVERTSTVEDMLHYAAGHAQFVEKGPNYLKPLEKGKLARPDGDGLIKGMLTGNIAEMQNRPSEVLGDDITAPVLDAYEAFAKKVAGDEALQMHRNDFDAQVAKQNQETLQQHRKDAGLNDAMTMAGRKLDSKFQNDPQRLEYGKAWLERLKGDRLGQDSIEKDEAKIQGNLSKNLLMNNIRAGIQNHLQLATTTLPEYGFKDTARGFDAYRAAVSTKSPELENMGGARFYEGGSKWDFFQLPEGMNQGTTYFTAKLKAKASGSSEAEAVLAGKKAIEQLQFRNRLGNEPRHYWKKSGATRLSLMSYAIQMRRLHLSWWKGLAEGMKTGDKAAVHKNARAILYFMGANALINGPTADLPDEVGGALKIIAPKTYNVIRQLDRFSLMGALDIDTAELARIPLTPAGFAVKVPVLWSKISSTGDKVSKFMQHPTPKTFISAGKDLTLLAPPVPVIGNKNAMNMLEFIVRSVIGDWKRYTPGGKKIQSNPVTELRAIPFGRPLSQDLEGARKDAG